MKLVEYLLYLGVQDIYFGSGARNASLLNLFNDEEALRVHQGFDERSLSFQALGCSKATRKPVVICTTSGSAAIETLSALAEAYFSGVQLILISCDRPHSLDKSFAPQMIDQAKVIKVYSRTFINHETDDVREINLNVEKKTVSYPLVINYKINKNEQFASYVRHEDHPIEYIQTSHIDLSKVLFIFNDHAGITPQVYKNLFDLVCIKQAYFYQEVESPFYEVGIGKCHKESSNEILYDEQLQQKILDGDFKHIIRIGRCPNSKAWRILHKNDIDLWHIDPFNKPCHSFGTVLKSAEQNVDYLIEELKSQLEEVEHQALNHSSIELKAKLANIIKKYPTSEISFVSKILSQDHFKSFYVGNSMPIRYAKFFKTSSHIIANRGVNGIDGLISSAIGYAQFKKHPVALILGDLSALYDISSLIQDIPSNLSIFILNNHGGQIFEQIKLHDVKNEHSLSFEKISDGFVNRIKAIKENDFSGTDILQGEARIFECLIDNEQTQNFWEDYREAL